MASDGESNDIPGLTGALAMLLLTGAAMAVEQLLRCASTRAITACVQSEGTDSAILGGLALVLGAALVIGGIQAKRKRPRLMEVLSIGV